MKVILIAAMARHRVIGINNTLPWKLSADLKRFKSLTTGHTIVMGRKTFESLGRPLPSRRHICVSRKYPQNCLTPDENWPEQVFWCGDLSAALRLTEQQYVQNPDEPVFIIGGAEIYTQALPLADALELTQIDAEFKGDAFFPFFENLFAPEETTAGEESGLPYRFKRFRSLRPDNLIVRQAVSADAEFIVRSQIRMAAETEELKLSQDVVSKGVERVFQDPSKGEYLIAERIKLTGERVPAGCLLLQKEWSDWRNGVIEWMHSVYVVPDERRSGVFSWMYKVAGARVRSRGTLGLRLYVDRNNTPARDAYRIAGMHASHYDLFEDLF
ncbi:MAG: GNAT family N-acetyltransferase [Proteobacteria bacterium]|nr:GNAT family N-acetyltransferase [Pseudomonadota bacterium]